MERYKRIDASIAEGYAFIRERNDCKKGCDKWLEAWAEIKALFAERHAASIDDLDKKYKWAHWITNYVQDLEMELQNAGVEYPGYHKKRAEYCRELLERCGSDELLIANTRCAMAEAHFEDGDETECDRLFQGWLEDDPGWELGYIAWSECYHSKNGGAGDEKAEEILLAGYARSDLRESIEIVAHLRALYEDTGRPDKAKAFEAVFSDLLSKMPGADEADREFRKALYEMQRAKPSDISYAKPTPVRVEKIGRNEPCPCGSGKKYKKCCGA